MRVRCGAQLRDGDVFLAEFAGMAHVPALQARFGDFGMKLEREGIVFDGECLIFVEFGARQVSRASGQIEGVPVPVEQAKAAGGQWREPGGRGLGSGGLDGEPADLRSARAGPTGSGTDAGAEGRGHELGSETDAERRLAREEALADGFDFGGEEGIVSRVADTDGPAHDDEQIATGGLRQREAGIRNINGLDREAAALQLRPQGTEILEGNMGEDDGLKGLCEHK